MGPNAEVAIACCRNSHEADASDLFPDPDSEMLVAALERIGVKAAMIAWDDPTVAWETIRAVIVRSTWDSVDRPDEYLRWARYVDRVSVLVNPANVLAWNLDKATYLPDLAAEGVHVVPTQYVRPESGWAVDGEIVVKPAISAGGRATARYQSSDRLAAEEHISRLLGQGQTVMVQPYLPAVEDPGEISLIFIAGRFSHAVRKGPVLVAGAGVVDRPWERMTFLGLADPSPADLAAGIQLQAILARRFGPLVYSRIDLIGGRDCEPQVVEVELIDPNLSFAFFPVAAETLAIAIKDQLVENRSADQ